MFGLSTVKLIVIAVAVLALIGTVVGVKLRLDHLNQEVATLTTQNQALTTANQVDAQNIKAANDAMAQLQQDDKQRSDAAQAAIEQAQAQAATKQAQVKQLLAQKSSGNKAQDCESLEQNLNLELVQ